MTNASLHALLRRLYKSLRDEMKRRFKRHVSLGDLLTDRWETAAHYGFGEGTSCYDNVLILGDVQVGARCWIGPNVVLDGTGGLIIGDDCTIGTGSQIYSHSTVPDAATTRDHDRPTRTAETRLEDGAFLAPQVIVEMGVTIGEDAVIGAMSFVNRDVPRGARAWGVPARVQTGRVETPETSHNQKNRK